MLRLGTWPAAVEIDRLAADHAHGARRAPSSAPFAQPRPPAAIVARVRAGEHGERLGQQPIARQNRHALAEHDMCGRTAPPERVVVHAGEIVVHERVAVHELDGDRGGQRERARGRANPAPRPRARPP